MLTVSSLRNPRNDQYSIESLVSLDILQHLPVVELPVFSDSIHQKSERLLLTQMPLGQRGLLIVVLCCDLYIIFVGFSSFPGPNAWAMPRIPSQLTVVSVRYHLDMLALLKSHGSGVPTREIQRTGILHSRRFQ